MSLTLLDDAMACNSDIGASLMQTLYQYKSALPYMGCCTLSSSITKGPKDAEREYWLQNEKYCAPQSNRRPRRDCIVQLMTWELLLKMKSGRPIMFQIKLIYTRYVLQLTLTYATSKNSPKRNRSACDKLKFNPLGESIQTCLGLFLAKKIDWFLASWNNKDINVSWDSS